MNDFITIVSGLPRSGTSMMMKMLEGGGMRPVTDDIRKADEDNPRGYYEFERAKKIKEDKSWLKDTVGKVFKIVSMLLQDLPPDYRYKVIFMKRDFGEMMASQEKMLKRLGRDGTGPGREKLAAIYTKHLGEIEQWLSGQQNIEALYVSYADVINDPSSSAAAINAFMGGFMDEAKMAGVVDRSLYRNRAGTL